MSNEPRSKFEIIDCALMKELKILKKRAEKAKVESDEAINAGSRMIEIHQQYLQICKREDMRKNRGELERLASEYKRLRELSEKKLTDIFDKQHVCEFEAQTLEMEIGIMRSREGIKGKENPL